MKKTFIFLLCCGSLHASAQTDSLQAVAQIIAFQQNLNEEYRDRTKSPLNAWDLDKFEGHDFFPIDLNYRVEAKLTVTEGTPFFAMRTTTDRVATERVYGHVSFTLAGKGFRLPVYQSRDLIQNPEYADYLFFPFADETNGLQTYNGGRYIDLRIPKGTDRLVIDFNMAYNPYCAYSARYSCPLVPAENQMDIEIHAGVRDPKREIADITNSDPSDSAAFMKVDVQPEYPGGLEKMIKFVRSNMTYPRIAVKQKIHGVVYVLFVVTPEGSITDVKTLKGISPECDQEAERVVWMMPRWKPGQHNGKNVHVRFVLPVKFRGRKGWN
jgi:TonB family protein